LPTEELSRLIVVELAYVSKVDSVEEKRVLQALGEYYELTFERLLAATQLPEGALSATLELLKFKELVEW
jgi:hypothetical protein